MPNDKKISEELDASNQKQLHNIDENFCNKKEPLTQQF